MKHIAPCLRALSVQRPGEVLTFLIWPTGGDLFQGPRPSIDMPSAPTVAVFRFLSPFGIRGNLKEKEEGEIRANPDSETGLTLMPCSSLLSLMQNRDEPQWNDMVDEEIKDPCCVLSEFDA